MTEKDSSRVIGRIMRFGVPLVILIFYVSASTGMMYTPDATFRSLSCATSIAAGGDCGPSAGGSYAVPNPAWIMLVGGATAMGLSSLLAAKVLSLFFGSLGILALYLLAFELTDDRLLAFGATLVLAVDAWMLQAGPSGSAAALTVAMMLAALFFLVRGEHVLAAVFSGICTLLFWQAAFLLLSVLVDVSLTAGERGRGLRMSGRAVASFVTVLLIWASYAGARGLPVWPGMQNTDIYTMEGWRIGALALAALVIAGGAASGFARKGEYPDGVFIHAVVWLWMVWLVLASIVWDNSLLFFLSPLLTIYAFLGLREIAAKMRRGGYLYPAALALAAALMLLNQLLYVGAVKPRMEDEARQMEEIRSLGDWMRNNLPEDVIVASEKPGMVAYFSGKQVRPFGGAFTTGGEPAYLVTSRVGVAGYELLATPGDEVERSLPGAHFALWRRR